jgi:hypothetical protein
MGKLKFFTVGDIVTNITNNTVYVDTVNGVEIEANDIKYHLKNSNKYVQASEIEKVRFEV